MRAAAEARRRLDLDGAVLEFEAVAEWKNRPA